MTQNKEALEALQRLVMKAGYMTPDYNAHNALDDKKIIEAALQQPCVGVEELCKEASVFLGKNYGDKPAFVYTILTHFLDHLASQGHLNTCEWQPIETAPGNGIYLVCDATDKGHPFVMSGEILHSESESTPGHLSFKHMTHWMPLPKAPERTN